MRISDWSSDVCSSDLLAYVACGRSDAYFESVVQPWDIAAGVLMVREAGGRICDCRGAATGPLHIETGPLHLVAGNVRLVDPLLNTIVSSGYLQASSCRRAEHRGVGEESLRTRT